MASFKRHRGHIVGHLEPAESQLLADLMNQIRQMLAGRRAQAPLDPLDAITGMATAPSTAPEDPALARLLPDFHRSDADLAGGMRMLYEPELLAAKDAAAIALLDSLPLGGGAVRLDPDEAQTWAAALNDVRLALGVRLNITSDDGEPDLEREELEGRVPPCSTSTVG
ncbi:DUF2017 domain-containing protein [Nakamurella antarctica]|uniref:DUF2017 domain-containing protein n=1 Tax=Nakamurella antarctica TaxID=1902245 RepID=A0A3G8ZM48_9ACTN|nr:DUF2017 domain-containing protein [Nakamurella antarctica]AZI58343.1 DUF2017 domain-containing protein [Nakamurella antarctica]